MKYLDLTYPMEEGMLSVPLPHHPPFRAEQMGAVPTHGSMTHKVSFGTHLGTHMDSPAHMFEGAHPTIDEIPLSVVIGKAKLLRIPKEEDGLITAGDVLETGVKLEKGDRILVCTGNSVRWGTDRFFTHSPVFSEDAGKLFAEKEIALLGMDLPSPDRGGVPLGDPKRNVVHKTLLGKGIIIVECLANLDEIPVREPEVILLPLRTKGLDGCPIRAVAAY